MRCVFCFLKENSVKTENARIESVNLHVKKILESFVTDSLSRICHPVALGLAADAREEGIGGRTPLCRSATKDINFVFLA